MSNKMTRGGIAFGPIGSGPLRGATVDPGARKRAEYVLEDLARLRRENARLRARLARVLIIAQTRGRRRPRKDPEAAGDIYGRAWSGTQVKGRTT